MSIYNVSPSSDHVAPDADGPEAVDVYQQSFNEVLPEALAVPEEQMIHQSTDAVHAVGAALGKLPNLTSLRTRMERLPKEEFDLREIDEFPRRARALRQAEAEVQVAVTPPGPTAEILSNCQEDEEKLFSQASVLVAHDIAPAQALETLRQNGGHRNVATNNVALISFARKHREKAGSLVFLSDKALNEMAARAAKLDEAVSARENQPRRIAEAQRNKRAIFTLFMRSYYEAERAVLFLEPSRADEFLPALFVRQGRRKLGEAESPAIPAPPQSGSGVVSELEGAPNAAPGMPGNSPILGKL